MGIRRRQLGFSLIELMIVVAITGILAAVAIPNFLGTMKKSKLGEASVAIDNVRQHLRLYYLDHNDMPPSSTSYLPSVGMCATGTGKTPATSQTVWDADPGFAALEFRIIEPGYFQYMWIRSSPTTGTLLARSDLDCDTVFGTIIASFSVINGSAVVNTISQFPDE